MKQNLLSLASIFLLGGVVLAFGVAAPGFLDPRNLLNIAIQAASLAIVATGITFVLITGGIDLSAGAVMFVSAAVAGKLALAGQPLAVVIGGVLLSGLLLGVLNGVLIVRGGLPPFIVTLGVLYAGRGLALYITETRAMNLPDELLRLFTTSWMGLPMPVWILVVTTAISELVLSRTLPGRQLYALGHSESQAALAGVSVRPLRFSVYVISGFAAALGGLVAVAQLGAVSPTFGYQRELSAIAAAVLGGTSLFGGRGRVFPGTIAGALLIQTVESGLVVLNADPYLYPMVMAAIIFVAVLLDSVRMRYVQSLVRRNIRAVA